MGFNFKYLQAAVAVCAGLSCLNARAASVLTYSGIGNEATQITTTYSPLHMTHTTIPTPYGTATVTPQGSGWVISFAPTSQFMSSVNNLTGGGITQETDGKLDFIATFDGPINLHATIDEGGSWAVAGNGTVGGFVGGVIVEAVDPFPAEPTQSSTSILAAFATDGTWTGAATIDGFVGSYTAYKFSIDNDLIAESVMGATGSATINKTSFTITIDGGGGGGQPAPLPLAAWGGMALMPMALWMVRRKRA
jgi:hypothetical protein